MSLSVPAPQRVNPFSTRFIRPGRVRPLDAAGQPLPLEALARQARCQRVSVLVGGHGSGKSNLLSALAAELSREGLVHRVSVRSLGDAARAASAVFRAGSAGIVCIDGWERLGWIGRALVLGAARIGDARLIVTAHRAGGLPVLVACATSLELFEGVVAQLPPMAGLVGPADRAASFARHAGNVREALLELYDRFEQVDSRNLTGPGGRGLPA